MAKSVSEEFRVQKIYASTLKRAMQTAVEDLLAEEILSGNITTGDRVTATVAKEKVIFKVKNTGNGD